MSKWKIVALADVAESVDYGVTASATQQPVGPKFLRITDIQDGAVNWDTVPWCECDARSAADSRLRAGDIVFARTGATTGKSFLIRECPDDVVFASYLIRVRVGEIAEARYISHFFQSANYWAQVTKGARGVAQPGVNATTLKALEISLPPLADQRRIAEVLDRAEALRAKRRAALAQLDTLTQALFLDLFGDPATNPKGWTTKPLGDAMSEVYRYPTYYDITYEEDGVPEVRGELLQEDGSIVTDKSRLRFISPKTSARFPRTVLAEGDLVMSVRGTIGKIGLIPAALAGANMTANLIRMAPDRSILAPTFAWHFTQTGSFKSQLANACSSTTILTIKAPDLKRLSIPLPPLPLQHDFARGVAAVEKLKTAHRASLAELDALFAALQHRAFRGEL